MSDEFDRTDNEPESTPGDGTPTDGVAEELTPEDGAEIGSLPEDEPAAEAPAEGVSEGEVLAPEDEVAAIQASLEESAMEPVGAAVDTEAVAAASGDADAQDEAEAGISAEETAVMAAVTGAVAVEEVAGAEPSAPATTEEQPLMDLGPDRHVAWWVWLIGVLGLAAIAAAGFALWYYLLSPVRVPRVVGKDIGQAAQALNDAHVRLGRTSEVPTSSAPPGTVITQTPKAGSEVDRDIEVALEIAAPPTTAAVPDVKGQTLTDAQKTLAAEELGALVVETYDPVTAAGMVISQLPTAGAELTPGTLVAVAVSRGPSPTVSTVPNLRGITTEEAQRVLAALDLVPAAYRSNDPSVPAGQIATQTPAPGTRVSARSSVMYLVSDGRALNPVTVPNVSNRTGTSASQLVKAAGLVAKTRQVAHPSVPAGSVIAQMPPSGAKVAKGSTVGLLVSRGTSELVAVPSVVGTAQAGAAKALTAAGFKPVMVPVPMATGVFDQVIAQWPAPQATWPQYLPVIAIYRER